MFLDLIFVHGLIYSGGFALIILMSVLINPRIWLQDFPENLKENIPPKSRTEINQTFITGFLFALFIVLFPLYSLSVLIDNVNENLNFWKLFFHSFSIMMICNFLYWLFFDIVIFNIIIGHIRTIPGLKKQFKFKGWKRQFFGLSIGVLSCTLISGFTVTVSLFFQ